MAIFQASHSDDDTNTPARNLTLAYLCLEIHGYVSMDSQHLPFTLREPHTMKAFLLCGHTIVPIMP